MYSNDYIFTYVKKYLNDEINLPSTLMIDGKWGSGKTHFVLKELIPTIQEESKKHVIYITVNGISTYTEFENRIQTAIMKLNLNEEQKKTVFEVISGIDGCLEESKLKESFGLISSLGKIGKKLYTDQKLKNTILILDDFERIKMDISVAMGIVNDLVEHKQIKCLIIANEKELENEYESYKKIKEKLISRTLFYKPNLEDFLAKLWDKTFIKKYNINNGEFLWNAISKEIYENCDGNLRTILSSFSIMNEVYEIIRPFLSSNDDVNEIILRDTFANIYRVEMWYKNGKSRLEPRYKREKREVYDFSEDKTQNNYFYSFQFVHKIVFDGVFDLELIKTSIQEYSEIVAVKGEVSPLQKLKNWYELEDSQNQKYYDELIMSIENNTADVKSYQDILKMCLLLDDIGYRNTNYKNIEDIIVLMKNNITENGGYCFEYDGLKGNLNAEKLNKVKKTLEEFRIISEETMMKKATESLNKKLNSKDWSDLLFYMAKTYKDNYQRLQGFLYLIDYDSLLKKIDNANNKELCVFRDSICLLYHENISEDIYPKDVDVAMKFSKDLMKLKGKGIINRNTIKYISNDMTRFFSNVEAEKI